MDYEEKAVVFECSSEPLIGIVFSPECIQARGVLVIVGGPQYRAGSHRQFTLLSRSLAQAGIPSMRFDYRGMGDSGGEQRNFEQVEMDIRAAVDAFFLHAPQIKEVVLWGLCDAASSAMFYAHQDSRISGLVLLNPWVRTSDGLAKAQFRHYYFARLGDPAFWRKLFSGRFEFRSSIRSILEALSRIAFPVKKPVIVGGDDAPLPERMRCSLNKFNGNILLILSGQDLTAREFEDSVRASKSWQELLASPRVIRRELADADHTFSRQVWREQVAQWTLDWMESF